MPSTGGWLFFISKPIFYVDRLDLNSGISATVGVAILIFTHTGQRSCSTRSRRAPTARWARCVCSARRSQAVRDRYKDDPTKQQSEMMAVYKAEQVNPASGCLPMLHADPGFLRAVQGDSRHHRNAPRAVLRLDPRPLRHRPDQPLHDLRPDPLEPHGGSRPCCISASGRSSWVRRCMRSKNSTRRRPTRPRRACCSSCR